MYKNLSLIIPYIILIYIVIKFFDYNIASWCIQHHLSVLQNIAIYISWTATGLVVGILILLNIIYSMITQNRIAIHIAKLQFLSLIITAIINTTLKIIIHRIRPMIIFYPLGHYSKTFTYSSMPSGHTAMICVLLIPIIYLIKNILLRIILMLYIFLVMICRIYTLNHWCSDTLVALLLTTIIITTIDKLKLRE